MIEHICRLSYNCEFHDSLDAMMHSGKVLEGVMGVVYSLAPSFASCPGTAVGTRRRSM